MSIDTILGLLLVLVVVGGSGAWLHRNPQRFTKCQGCGKPTDRCWCDKDPYG